MAELRTESDGEDFHSLPVTGDDAAEHDMEEGWDPDMAPPTHPMSFFQDAFEESIADAIALDRNRSREPVDAANNDVDDDAQARRRRLLHARHYEDVRPTRFIQKRGAKHHPFLKLCSQIVFGMHLLQQQQAKSNEEVVRILQNHVNEVDALIERISEDLNLAFNDIRERVKYLKLPMEHMDIFEGMLNDRKFRMDLLTGNEKIEKIIRRTAQAMNDSMIDIQTGIKTTKELGVYLNRIEDIWPAHNEEIGDVFVAMRGNEKGWRQFLRNLRKKGSDLGDELRTLNATIADIAKLAGEASRRNRPLSASRSTLQVPPTASSQPRVRSKYAQSHKKSGRWLDKPLPQAPGSASREAVTKTSPVPSSIRYERSREQAHTPRSRDSSEPSNDSLRHKSWEATGKALDVDGAWYIPSESVKELAQPSEALRSHPPTPPPDGNRRPSCGLPGRTRSSNAAEVFHGPVTKDRPQPRSTQNERETTAATHRRSTSVTLKSVESIGKESKALARSGTVIKYVPREPTLQQRTPSISTGFSRRLSMKIRNLPVPIKYATPRETSARGMHSVFSPNTDGEQDRGVTLRTNLLDRVRTMRRAQEAMEAPVPGLTAIPIFELPALESLPASVSASQPRIPELPASERQASELPAVGNQPPSRDGPRLGLFPKNVGPLTPSQASHLGKDYFSTDSMTQVTTPKASPQPTRQTHQAKASRTMSIRNFFHKKGDSRSAMAA